uniref:Tyr recombinase domain-containing protein n=1 Tax=Macrostomum lignano TaxID=282301 RepID=A0A1I8HW71_9PLAT
LGQKCPKIHENLTLTHGPDAISRRTVYRWLAFNIFRAYILGVKPVCRIACSDSESIAINGSPLSKDNANDLLDLAENNIFSDKAHRGLRYLQEFMKNLSEKAKLSKPYTNHCIRVTRICDLESEGHAVHDIMLVTGHKSEATVRRFLHKRRDRSLYKSSVNVHTAMKKSLDCMDRAEAATSISGDEEFHRVQGPPEKKCESK